MASATRFTASLTALQRHRLRVFSQKRHLVFAFIFLSAALSPDGLPPKAPLFPSIVCPY